MQKRICWKKGMRLTDNVFRTSDDCYGQLLDKAFALAAAGRFGLCPSPIPFELSLNISKGIVDVETLTCLAITRNGSLIDAHYDTRYTNSFDTRVLIPEEENLTEYLLIISTDGQWQETNDGLEEPVYHFALANPNTPIADNALPIGRLVDNYGWHMDDIDFVPPCLLLSAHKKYIELLDSFLDVLKAIDTKTFTLLHTTSSDAARIYWPLVQNVRLTVDKERDTLTPMSLLGNVQKCVSAFTCACELDEYIELADAENFMAYIYEPYNYKNAYQMIKEGIGLCLSINEKIEKMQAGSSAGQSAHIGAPTIANDQLYQNCRTRLVNIPVYGYQPEATVLYSIDGSEPSHRLSRQGTIIVENGFSKMKVPEPDKEITIKLKATANGVESPINTFTVTLHKDYKSWDGYEI